MALNVNHPISLTTRPQINEPLLSLSASVEATVVCIFIGIVVFLSQAHFGYSTRILDMGDEGLLWYGSQRTELGDVPLRDYFSYDPGRYYWSALMFKMLRADGLFEQIVANDLFGLIGLFVIYILMCNLSLDRRWRIGTALLIGIAMGFPRHKIYEQALSLLAITGIALVLSRPGRRSWFGYGLLTGLAAFTGRNSGLYFVIAGLLACVIAKSLGFERPTWHALSTYLVGGLLGYLPMFVMLLFVPGFPAAFLRSILLNSKQLIPVAIPYPWRLHSLGLYGLQPLAASVLFMAVPLTYPTLLLLLPRMRSGLEGRGERVLAYAAAIAGTPYLFHAFSYARFGHLAQASLPFIVGCAATSALFWKTGWRTHSLYMSVCLTALILACWLPREPALEYLRARDRYKGITIGNTQFQMISEDVDILRASQIAFQRCGSREGTFLSSPTYPSPYAFLRTRSPFWEVYFILFRLPSNEAADNAHIESLSKVSIVLLDEGDRRALHMHYPKLYAYLVTQYQLWPTGIPTGDFHFYYRPQLCGPN